MKALVIPIIILLFFSVVTIPNSFADESKKKFRFWGNHNIYLYGEPQIDFRIDPLVSIPYVVNGTIQVGDYKTKIYGGGFLKPDYYFYDRQCKSLKGFENVFSDNGDFVRIDYYGKVCYMGSNVKVVNLIFEGKNPKGIFENAEIKGTLSGNSDRYERLYNLQISSVLVYNAVDKQTKEELETIL